MLLVAYPHGYRVELPLAYTRFNLMSSDIIVKELHAHPHK